VFFLTREQVLSLLTSVALVASIVVGIIESDQPCQCAGLQNLKVRL